MSDDAIRDPEALRWVEAGVSGLARRREWDTVELVALPELQTTSLEQFRFALLGDGTAVRGDDVPVSDDVVRRLAERVRAALAPPFEALAARQTRLEWSVAARALRIDEVELPGVRAAELVVAVGPDGASSLLVDGDEVAGASAELDAAARALERIGRERFESFVVRARRAVGDRFAISVDPL